MTPWHREKVAFLNIHKHPHKYLFHFDVSGDFVQASSTELPTMWFVKFVTMKMHKKTGWRVCIWNPWNWCCAITCPNFYVETWTFCCFLGPGHHCTSPSALQPVAAPQTWHEGSEHGQQADSQLTLEIIFKAWRKISEKTENVEFSSFISCSICSPRSTIPPHLQQRFV